MFVSHLVMSDGPATLQQLRLHSPLNVTTRIHPDWRMGSCVRLTQPLPALIADAGGVSKAMLPFEHFPAESRGFSEEPFDLSHQRAAVPFSALLARRAADEFEAVRIGTSDPNAIFFIAAYWQGEDTNRRKPALLTPALTRPANGRDSWTKWEPLILDVSGVTAWLLPQRAVEASVRAANEELEVSPRRRELN